MLPIFPKNKTPASLRAGLGNVLATNCRPSVINFRARAFKELKKVSAAPNKREYGICDLRAVWGRRKLVKETKETDLNHIFAITKHCIRAERA